ncbi:MAG: UvrB/UvrC motif-containing protein [Opitutales bacterium]|nr:UvrB/UvrC motif-containing protein [Opitutales bacterium]
MLLNDLKKGDKFACPDCYTIMDDSVIDMLMQMHNASKHVGKSPQKHKPNVDTSSIFVDKTNLLNEDFISDLEDVVSSAIEEVSGIQSNIVFNEANMIGDLKLDVVLSQDGDKSTSIKEPKQTDKRVELERLLEEAIKQERYEDAAKIRDELNSLPKS